MATLIMKIEVTDELDIQALTDPHEVAEDLVAAYHDIAGRNPDTCFDVEFVSAEWAG